MSIKSECGMGKKENLKVAYNMQVDTSVEFSVTGKKGRARRYLGAFVGFHLRSNGWESSAGWLLKLLVEPVKRQKRAFRLLQMGSFARKAPGREDMELSRERLQLQSSRTLWTRARI